MSTEIFVIGIKHLLDLIVLEASNLLSLLCFYVSRRAKVLSDLHIYTSVVP